MGWQLDWISTSWLENSRVFGVDAVQAERAAGDVAGGSGRASDRLDAQGKAAAGLTAAPDRVSGRGQH
ncbi:MAG: hypothetical protein CL859_09795 [Cyanobium sp. ARS6]|nr:hypothetical protein [Cyanobium sp. ARS6]